MLTIRWVNTAETRSIKEIKNIGRKLSKFIRVSSEFATKNLSFEARKN